jgi:hypothetical protein
VEVDADRAAGGARGGGAARRRQRERLPEVERRREIPAVAGVLDRVEQRGVDEPAGELDGVGDGGGQSAHQRRDRHGGAAVGVQPRQLAAGVEAREAVVPREQQVARCGGQRRPVGAADQDRAARAEAVERLDRLGHDWRVVTPVGATSPLEPESLLEDEEVAVAVLAEVPSAGSLPDAICT